MDWGKLLENVIMAAIPVLVPVLAAWIVAKVRELWVNVSSNMSDEAVFWLKQAADIAVKAAEQQGLAKLIHDKKADAIATAQAYLKVKGLNVDVALISAAIEKAVYDMNVLEEDLKKLEAE